MIWALRRTLLARVGSRCLGYNAGGLQKFSPPDTTVVQGKSGQKGVIRDFLFRYYLADDPLLCAAGVNKDENLLDFWIKDIRPEFTLLAVDPKSGIVKALACNTIVNKDTSLTLKETAADVIKDQKSFRVACFFADVTEKAKLFTRFNISEHFECTFVATHPEARKKGLGKHLILHSMALGQSAGFPLIRIDCTNNNTSRIAKRLHMERLPRRQIVDYVDMHGRPWIPVTPNPPNHHLDTYFARLCPGLCSRFPPPPPSKPKKKLFRFF